MFGLISKKRWVTSENIMKKEDLNLSVYIEEEMLPWKQKCDPFNGVVKNNCRIWTGMFREKTLLRDTKVYKLCSAIIAPPTEASKEKRNLNKSRWYFLEEIIEVPLADENIKTFRNIFQCQVKILRCVPSSLPRNFIPKLFYKY